jgi:hypothetical protein
MKCECVMQRERCDCNTACLKQTGHLNEANHACQVHGEYPLKQMLAWKCGLVCSCIDRCCDKQLEDVS